MKNQGQVLFPISGDPFARPAGDVTVEEWRILICSVAGRLRLSQGSSNQIVIPANRPVLVARNDKSFALFVSIQQLGNGFAYAIGGDQRSANQDVGIVVASGQVSEQVLLPKEHLYAFSTAGGTLVVTQVTV